MGVFKHLSTILASEKVLEYDHKKLFAARWLSLKGMNKVVGNRALLDRLHMTNFVWSPYASHRDLRPFEDRTLYFGYRRFRTYMQLYLTKRVLKHFRYTQRIPLDPLECPVAYEKCYGPSRSNMW
ncbi:hypothetical protein HKD37_19G054326 [Glycine soja]